MIHGTFFADDLKVACVDLGDHNEAIEAWSRKLGPPLNLTKSQRLTSGGENRGNHGDFPRQGPRCKCDKQLQTT